MYERLTMEDKSKPVDKPEVVADILTKLLLMRDEIEQDKEYFYVIELNARNRIKSIDIVGIGSLTGCIVNPRETFRRAITQGCANIIVAHNHPSGDPEPSDEDISITQRLTKAGEIVGIKLFDHVIFTKDRYNFYSFKDKGLI